MYLARLTTISFYPIYADTFWIHVPYLIGESGVKLKYEKAEFENKKGESCLPESPMSVGI
jgi:hypothetical protein